MKITIKKKNSLNWTSTGLSDIGKWRNINQDAYLERTDIGLWVVADGLGGHDAGEVASQAIIDILKTVPPPSSMNAFIKEIEKRLYQSGNI